MARRRFPERVAVCWTCIHDHRRKLITDHLGDRLLLHGLENNPAEIRSCAAEHPWERQRLKYKLDEMDARVPAGEQAAPMPEGDTYLWAPAGSGGLSVARLLTQPWWSMACQTRSAWRLNCLAGTRRSRSSQPYSANPLPQDYTPSALSTRNCDCATSDFGGLE